MPSSTRRISSFAPERAGPERADPVLMTDGREEFFGTKALHLKRSLRKLRYESCVIVPLSQPNESFHLRWRRPHRKESVPVYVDLWPTDGTATFATATAKAITSAAENSASRLLELGKTLLGRDRYHRSFPTPLDSRGNVMNASMGKILLIDNHDSFVHNLARYLRRLGQTTEVVRSDSIDAAQCKAMNPTAIVISPGPKRPEQAGCSVDVIRELGGSVPILGVCLGHQAIGHAFGAAIVRCEGMHGSSSEIAHDGTGLFEGCRPSLRVGRYHSLAIDGATLPSEIIVSARTVEPESTSGQAVIMAIRHRELPICGVQFHPESVLSEEGADILANFLRIATLWHEQNSNRKRAS
jgi:anthranilate synthase/aminodeoxychorismate synthase-like glutamine amidotransferase